METRMEFSLLAANEVLNSTNLMVLLALIGVLVFGLVLLVFFSFINLWLQAFLTGARVGFFDLVAMKFRKVDYAMLVKIYGAPVGGPQERRYSPAECCGSIREAICGNPDPQLVSTSHVERANLTMRMGMRRFTRLTNGFSKKIENLEHAVALHFMHYNFGRVHKTLRVTPAMEARIADHVWSLEEIAALAQ